MDEQPQGASNDDASAAREQTSREWALQGFTPDVAQQWLKRGHILSTAIQCRVACIEPADLDQAAADGINPEELLDVVRSKLVKHQVEV